MAMMMGPVTTGGKKRMMRPMPKTVISRLMTRYTRPANTTPPQA